MNGYCECGKIAERNGKCASCNRLERKAAGMKLPEEPQPIKKQSDEMKKNDGPVCSEESKVDQGKEMRGHASPSSR